MSQEDVERLRRIYAAWAEGDFWAGASLYDPYVVYVSHGSKGGPDPDHGPHYGLEAMTAYMRRVLDSWESWRIAAIDFREAGDTVVVRARRTGVGKRSHVPVEDEAFHVWTFRGGKVIRMEVFADEAEALEAAGLSE
jgi:ketosteroid isomerase-like protein